MRLAVVQAPQDVRPAVRPIECHAPVTGRTALDGHDVLGRGFVQTDRNPGSLDLHFTGLRIGFRHSSDLPCWSEGRQGLGVTPLFALYLRGNPASGRMATEPGLP